MLPASALNALRRDAVAALDEKRGEAPPVKDRTEEIAAFASALPASVPPKTPALRMRFQTAEQVFAHERCQVYILPLREIAAHPALIDRFGEKLAAELPVLIFPFDEPRVRDTLAALKEKGLKKAAAENIGAVKLIRDAGLEAIGGAHLNVTNRLALSELNALGCRDATASFELNLSDIASLRSEGRTGYIAYGRMPLMRFRACPQRDERGCGSCKGAAVITDRKNERFPLLCEEKRFSTVLNSVPLCAVGLHTPPADFITLYATVEAPDACARIAERVLSGGKPEGPITAGQYNKKLL